MLDTETELAALDAILTDCAFGRSEYITDRLHACYERRIVDLAKELPSAGALASNLVDGDPRSRYRVYGDMVFRCAVQHAMRRLRKEEFQGLSLEECEAVFVEINRQIEQHEDGPLRAGLVDYLGPEAHHGAIWRTEYEDSILGRAFCSLVEEHYGQRPCSATSEEIATLQQGVQLLEQLLPSVTKSALSHTHLVAVFAPEGPWQSRSSSSEYWLSGTIFLSRRLLASPWLVAEYVLHESLHQQLYDFRQGHSLLRSGFDREDAPTITSWWNVPDITNNNTWDVHRALAAFHVYVHLALLSLLADASADRLEPSYGRQSGPLRMTSGTTAIVRARYLEEQLRGVLGGELGQAGQRLVEWFGSVLEAMNPSPPPAGARTHLLLDRYGREAREIEFVARRGEKPAQFAVALREMIARETATLRSVLAALDRTEAIRELDVAVNDALGQSPEHEIPVDQLGQRFARVRNIVTRSILALAPDGYSLPGAPETTQMIETMILDSSEAVRAAVGR